MVGALLDTRTGSLSFLADGVNLGVAFGVGASLWHPQAQRAAGAVLRRARWVPCFALRGLRQSEHLAQRPHVGMGIEGGHVGYSHARCRHGPMYVWEGRRRACGV